MIQNISPKRMDVDFKNRVPNGKDYVIVIEDSNVLIKKFEDETIGFLEIEELQECVKNIETKLMYLFAVDDAHYYLYTGKDKIMPNNKNCLINKRDLFANYNEEYGFIGLTASHINEWFLSNQYCGKCGQNMKADTEQRSMICTVCDLVKYPRLDPVVIVGIHDGDKILLTRAANSDYTRYALVAGFVEVGEALEDAVRREVMEEVGLKVKNITYYGSQPWGLTGGLLAGYFAELDGDSTVKLDLEELSEGTWFTKETMPEVYENEKSLTRTMMYDWYSRQ